MLRSNSKAKDDKCFPVSSRSIAKWIRVQRGKKEDSTQPRENACMQTSLVSCFPQWGTWSGHENCDWPTYKAQELFFVHPSLRRAWKWRMYLEGSCSLNALSFFPWHKCMKKLFFLTELARQNEGIKIFFFSVLPLFAFSKSACHYLNSEMDGFQLQ